MSHATQAGRLLTGLGLLPRGAPLPQSKVSDTLACLASLAAARRKVCAASHACAWCMLLRGALCVCRQGICAR